MKKPILQNFGLTDYTRIQKSFYWCGSTSNSVFERNLESESLEDAKAELEKILLESSIKALEQADDDYRKHKEYCKKMVRYLSDSSAAIEDMRARSFGRRWHLWISSGKTWSGRNVAKGCILSPYDEFIRTKLLV